MSTRKTKFPAFHRNAITHAGDFKLDNGATLTLATTPTSWYIRGRRRGVKSRHIVLSNEAVGVIVASWLLRHPVTPPLPNVGPLLPFNPKAK